jgi:hypothetical protein
MMTPLPFEAHHHPTHRHRWTLLVAATLVGLLVLLWPRNADALVDPSSGTPAARLTAKYIALRTELDNSQFRRPIHLDSAETKDTVSGEIFALLNAPFSTVADVLDKPAQWCEILLLHLNNKFCNPAMDARGPVLHVVVGSKTEQALKDAYPVDFAYRVSAKTPEYLHVDLDAAQGPLSTRNYRILLEATPAGDGRTFIHLSYAYSFGIVGELAMKTYLGTVARSKIGFSVVNGPHGEPHPVGGMRGAVERNTMRYYLAIEAFLGALSAPPGARLEKAFRDWFAATETYAPQLHEIGESEYLAMKRKEYSRQQGKG